MTAATQQQAHKLEKPSRPIRFSEFRRDVGPLYVANAVVALIFSASGPLAVILASGQAGNLTEAQLTSWVMAAFAFNGLLTIIMTVVYRMPMAFFWTIPGTVLVGNSLRHLEWAEVLGAFIAVGVLVTLLGLGGVAGRVMKLAHADRHGDGRRRVPAVRTRPGGLYPDRPDCRHPHDPGVLRAQQVHQSR